ncbi:MAG: hypothetical protein NXY57DRAFT_1044414, partial [Lentinula lateritia]
MVSGNKRKRTGGSNSRRLQQYGSGSANALDFLENKIKTVKQTQITKLKAQQDRLKPNGEYWEEVRGWNAIGGTGTGDDDDNEDLTRVEGVLHGEISMEHSHAGDWQDIAGAYWQTDLGKRRRKEHRTRRDRTERRNQRFLKQIGPMTDAYMLWDAALGKDGLGEKVLEEYEGDLNAQTITAVDVFRSFYGLIQTQESDIYWSSSLVRQGLFPCSPGIATVAITTRALEVFRVQSLRCPRLSIKAFVKSLCDIQGVPFKPYLQEQFSIAFDLYLSVLSEVRRRVLQALGRDSPNWRLTNACPCCLYHVDGEPTLQFQLLCTVDGNNSLKRFARKEQVGELDESSSLAEFNSKERLDTRAARGDYYLSQDEVNRWSKESIQGMFEGV